jgi:single-strand DNA-binding protein
MDLNKVMIIGRLTRDPELRTIPSGASVCQLGLATNYVYTNQQTGQKVEQVEYHNVVLWRKLGEIAGQYLKKGRRVYIEGRLVTRSWDGQDGQKRYKTEIVGDNMIMLDGAVPSSQGGMNSGYQPSAGGGNTSPSFSRQPSSANNSPAPQEELPTIDQSSDEGVRVEDIPF